MLENACSETQVNTLQVTSISRSGAKLCWICGFLESLGKIRRASKVYMRFTITKWWKDEYERASVCECQGEREREMWCRLTPQKSPCNPPWKCASLKCRVVTPFRKCPIYIYHGFTQIYRNLQTRLRAFSKNWLPLLNSAWMQYTKMQFTAVTQLFNEVLPLNLIVSLERKD